MKLSKIALYTVLAGQMFFGATAIPQTNSNNHFAEQRQEQVVQGLEKELAIHSSGTIEEWAARKNGDYAPRTEEIFDKLDTEKSKKVTGGFKEEIRLFSHTGTNTDTVSSENIEQLIDKYTDKIQENKRLHKALKSMIKDQSMYTMIKQFFEDGGVIEAFEYNGFYSNKFIAAGLKGTDLDVKKSLYHETMHYFFDKTDAIIKEAEGGVQEDHEAISPLEQRLKIIGHFRQGETPFADKKVRALYSFTTDGKIGKKLQGYVDNNNLDSLKQYVNSEDFERGFVRAGIYPTLSSISYYDEHPGEREGSYQLTPGQTIDVAFLYAVNGAIIQQTTNMGIEIARQNSTTLTEAFKTPEFQERFDKFLTQYTNNLENPQAQPYKTAEIN